MKARKARVERGDGEREWRRYWRRARSYISTGKRDKYVWHDGDENEPGGRGGRRKRQGSAGAFGAVQDRMQRRREYRARRGSAVW
jgi:hypothetical protein